MKKFLPAILALLCVLLLLPGQQAAAAEPKQANLTYLEHPGDLVVMFQYDRENVDIAFLSPSGTVLRYGDAGVEMAEGDLWRTYKISNAEQGQWKVEYDLGANEKIDFSIIRQNLGAWLQYVKVQVADGAVQVRFLAKSGDVSYYNYEVYAVSTADPTKAVKLGDGSALVDKEEIFTAGEKTLSSGSYTIRIDLIAISGDAELFDSMTSEEITYENPNEPGTIAGFYTQIDPFNHTVTVDWEDFADHEHNGYRLSVYGDGDTLIYQHEPEARETRDSAVYPSDTGVLRIELQWCSGSLWSSPRVRTVDLKNGERLSLRTDEITGGGEAILDYSVTELRTLKLWVDGEAVDTLEVSGSGFVSVPLHPDINRLYAAMTVADSVCYVIDTRLFSDVYPPEIQLFEDLDRKIFTSDRFQLIGRVVSSETLTVNGEQVELQENGDFSHTVSLTAGENLLELRAADPNGNEALMSLTVICRPGGMTVEPDSVSVEHGEARPLWVRYLPLMAALLASALIAVVSWAFLRHSSRKNGVKMLIVWDVLVGLVETVSVVLYMLYVRQSNSLAFLDIVERSQQAAIRHLRLQEIFGQISLAGAGVLAVMIVLTVLLNKRNKRENKG